MDDSNVEQDVPCEHGVKDSSETANIATFLRDAERRFRDRPALRCAGSALSYGQLDRQAKHFANFLKWELGLSQGEVIAIGLDQGVQFLVVWLGAQLAGVDCLIFDPAQTAPVLRTKLDRWNPRATILATADLASYATVLSAASTDFIIAIDGNEYLPGWQGVLHHTKQFIDTVLSGASTDFTLAIWGLEDLPGWQELLHRAKQLIADDDQNYPFSPIYLTEAIARGESQFHNLDTPWARDSKTIFFPEDKEGSATPEVWTQQNLVATSWRCANQIKAMSRFDNERVLTTLSIHRPLGLSAGIIGFLLGGHEVLPLPKPAETGLAITAIGEFKPSVIVADGTLLSALGHNSHLCTLAPNFIKLTLATEPAMTAEDAALWQQATGCPIAILAPASGQILTSSR